MTVSILGDRVLIRKIESDKTTAGGLVVLTGDDIHTPKGLVLKVGEGRTTKEGLIIPISVEVGNTVMYYPNAGLPVMIEGEDLLVLREEEIYAVVD
jgi:chaperonin GroES